MLRGGTALRFCAQPLGGKPEARVPCASRLKILDSSVLIDGRIAPLCELGFMEGDLVVAEFIRRELQQLSTASDPLRQARGRRGLATLTQLEKIIELQVTDQDFPEIVSVDDRLIVLTKCRNGCLVTNDVKLERAAILHGLRTLNVNRLAFALRPAVIPGQRIRLAIVALGREERQGIAYLDDGCRVLVNECQEVGRQIDVTIQRHLQTPTGGIYFARVCNGKSA